MGKERKMKNTSEYQLETMTILNKAAKTTSKVHFSSSSSSLLSISVLCQMTKVCCIGAKVTAGQHTTVP